MTDIFEKLKSKGITDSSLKLYTNNLRRLNDGNEVTNLTFLKDFDTIVGKLDHYKPNTRRSYLISVVSFLKEEPKLKKLYDKYYELMMKYNKELAVNNDKSETQKANWISQDDVLKIYAELAEKAVPLIEKKRMTEKEYNSVLDWVILSLYCLQPPRRNADYQLCVAVKKYDSEHADKKFNYLDTTNWKFIFNNFKTSGTYKSQSFDVNEALKEVLQTYLTKVTPLRSEFKKKNGSIPLLVDYEGHPFEANNSITRILNKIFGKRIGVSMLRNIYLTNKYGAKIEQLNNDATFMGTSSNVIKDQYVKLDTK
jgi:hypothetical protein